MKALTAAALLLAALALAGVATGGPIGPPVDTRGGSWVASCAHPDHPATYETGNPSTACGWVTAPGRFASCHEYPGGAGIQLTCYSPVSGWVVNIPSATTPGARPSAHRVATAVGLSTPALTLKAGLPWYDSSPERSAEAVCRATKQFFRCDLVVGPYGVWFKPDGSFVLYQRLPGSKTGGHPRTAIVYGSR